MSCIYRTNIDQTNLYLSPTLGHKTEGKNGIEKAIQICKNLKKIVEVKLRRIWTSVFEGKWINNESVSNKLLADVTHLNKKMNIVKENIHNRLGNPNLTPRDFGDLESFVMGCENNSKEIFNMLEAAGAFQGKFNFMKASASKIQKMEELSGLIGTLKNELSHLSNAIRVKFDSLSLKQVAIKEALNHELDNGKEIVLRPSENISHPLIESINVVDSENSQYETVIPPSQISEDQTIILKPKPFIVPNDDFQVGDLKVQESSLEQNVESITKRLNSSGKVIGLLQKGMEFAEDRKKNIERIERDLNGYKKFLESMVETPNVSKLKLRIKKMFRTLEKANKQTHLKIAEKLPLARRPIYKAKRSSEEIRQQLPNDLYNALHKLQEVMYDNEELFFSIEDDLQEIETMLKGKKLNDNFVLNSVEKADSILVKVEDALVSAGYAKLILSIGSREKNIEIGNYPEIKSAYDEAVKLYDQLAIEYEKSLLSVSVSEQEGSMAVPAL